MKRVIGAIVAGALCAIVTLTGCGMDRDEFDRETAEQINAANDLMGTPYKNPMLSDYVLAPDGRGDYTLHYEDCPEVDTDGDGILNANCYRMSVHQKHTYRVDAKQQQAYLNRNKDGQTTLGSGVGNGLVVWQDRLEDAVIVINSRKIGNRRTGVITECWRMRGESPWLREESGFVVEDAGDTYLIHTHTFLRACLDVQVDANGVLAEGFERKDNQFSEDWRMAEYELKKLNERFTVAQMYRREWERVGEFIAERDKWAEKGRIRYDYKPIAKHKCRFE